MSSQSSTTKVVLLAGAGIAAGLLLLQQLRHRRATAKLEGWLTAWTASGCLPGASLLVVHKDRELYFGAAGFADVAAAKPVARDTIFRIYSMTKPVTAALCMIFVDRGVLSLDDDIAKFIPCFSQDKMRVLIGTICLLHPPLATPRLLTAAMVTAFRRRRVEPGYGAAAAADNGAAPAVSHSRLHLRVHGQPCGRPVANGAIHGR